MRPTETFTPEGSSNTYVFKTYATAQEKRDVQDMYASSIALLPEDQRNLTSKIYAKLQDATLKMMLVSINGHKDGDDVEGKPFDAVAFLLSLPSNEFDAVYENIKEALEGEKKTVR